MYKLISAKINILHPVTLNKASKAEQNVSKCFHNSYDFDKDIIWEINKLCAHIIENSVSGRNTHSKWQGNLFFLNARNGSSFHFDSCCLLSWKNHTSPQRLLQYYHSYEYDSYEKVNTKDKTNLRD